MDTQPLGVLCAHAMETLGELYAESERAVVLTAALVIEVEDGDDSRTLVTATDARLWVQRAFLDEGIAALDREIDRQEDEAEETE